MKRIRMIGLGAVVLGMMFSAASADAAHAPPTPSALPCGTVITKDTTLQADITGCTGDGLVIGADHVTLDLNGHTVSGAVKAGHTVNLQCDEFPEGEGFECV